MSRQDAFRALREIKDRVGELRRHLEERLGKEGEMMVAPNCLSFLFNCPIMPEYLYQYLQQTIHEVITKIETATLPKRISVTAKY
jgi:hypothetical protein